MASLRLVPVSGPPIDIVKDQSMVGRDPGCEVVVTDGSVSRRHARLEKRGSAWWVVDQGSANGTYINSLKIGEQVLKDRQELRFGALAFRVDLREDPEATVATPILLDSATVMAPASPPPMPPAAPTPLPTAPPPLPAAATGPPAAPPSAAAARERFRPAGPSAPVPQMPAGAPPAKKGKGPLFWIAGGCGGCLLMIVALIAIIAGGVWVSTQGARGAARTWVSHLQANDLEAVRAGSTERFNRVTSDAELASLAKSVEANALSFRFGGGRSVSMDSDTVELSGVLRGAEGSRPVTFHLVRVGSAWKVDDVRLQE
jgi:hypothetical protein